MRFLTDENISPVIAAALQAAGHDVLTVTGTMASAPDHDVLAVAIRDARVIITEDKDFGELAFRDGLKPSGIIRLALPGYRPKEKAARLCAVLVNESEAVIGKALVIEPGRVRLRPFL